MNETSWAEKRWEELMTDNPRPRQLKDFKIDSISVVDAEHALPGTSFRVLSDEEAFDESLERMSLRLRDLQTNLEALLTYAKRMAVAQSQRKPEEIEWQDGNVIGICSHDGEKAWAIATRVKGRWWCGMSDGGKYQPLPADHTCCWTDEWATLMLSEGWQKVSITPV